MLLAKDLVLYTMFLACLTTAIPFKSKAVSSGRFKKPPLSSSPPYAKPTPKVLATSSFRRNPSTQATRSSGQIRGTTLTSRSTTFLPSTAPVAIPSSNRSLPQPTLSSRTSLGSVTGTSVTVTKTPTLNATSTIPASAEPTVDPKGPPACGYKLGTVGSAAFCKRLRGLPPASTNINASRYHFDLSRRAGPYDPASYPDKLFIGFTGTQSDNAKEYETGGLRKLSLTSGADGQLGGGLYVTDDIATAEIFANFAMKNVNHMHEEAGSSTRVTEKICVIYAKDRDNWKNCIQKIWFPARDSSFANKATPEDQWPKLVEDSSDPDRSRIYEMNRVGFAHKHGVIGEFVRFSKLDPTRPDSANQLMAPESIQRTLVTKCYDSNPQAILQTLADQVPAQFEFSNLIDEWKIVNPCPIN